MPVGRTLEDLRHYRNLDNHFPVLVAGRGPPSGSPALAGLELL